MSLEKRMGTKMTSLYLKSSHTRGNMLTKYKQEAFQMPPGLVASCTSYANVWMLPGAKCT